VEVVASDQAEAAGREHTFRRYQSELQRLQSRLDVLYEDRLDRRIDGDTYDEKAGNIRKQQQQIRLKMRLAEAPVLLPTNQAIDLLAMMSRAAELFVHQSSTHQRQLLRLVLQEASWKMGELRMSLREPFQQLRLSNQEMSLGCNNLHDQSRDFDNWQGRFTLEPTGPSLRKECSNRRFAWIRTMPALTICSVMSIGTWDATSSLKKSLSCGVGLKTKSRSQTPASCN